MRSGAPGNARARTPDELAERLRITAGQAESMLADFAARGVVEPTGDGYRLTEQGARVAHDFAGAVEEVGS